ncbi:MAG: heme biosynthesis HemY N-terminal domain-containing protein [Pseudomonadota bacterium]
MRAILITAVIVAIVIAAAVFLQQDAGFVRAEFMGASYDGPLAIVAMAALLGFVALYIIVRLLGWLFSAPTRFGKMLNRRQSDAALNRLAEGQIELAEGRFGRAERVLTKDVPAGPQATLHYLAAAEAANAAGNSEQRDAYIKRAITHNPNAKNALHLKQAKMQLDGDDYESALDTLNRMRGHDPRNAVAQGLRARALRRAGRYDDLVDNLAELRKRDALPAVELDALEAETASAVLSSCADNLLTKIWKALPATARDNAGVVHTYARRLLGMNDVASAERVVGDALSRSVSDKLAHLYGAIEGRDAARQLARVETLLKSHENNASLLAAAGQICLRQELWGKAKSYLEQSAALGDSAAAQNGLAEVARQNGDADSASAHFERGLKLALS